MNLPELQLGGETVGKFIELSLFAWKLWRVRLIVSFSVTSWWRSSARNKAVGGSPTSLHLEGLAADLVPDSGTIKAGLLAAAVSCGLYGRVEADHVHVQSRPLRYG